MTLKASAWCLGTAQIRTGSRAGDTRRCIRRSAATTASTFTGADALIAACARDDQDTVQALTAAEPQLKSEVIGQGGTLLAEFSGVGNLAGVRNLLDLGVSATALYREGDG